MSLTIERAGRADRDAVLALLTAQLVEHDIHVGGEALAAALDGVFDQPSRGTVLVARDGGRIVAVAYLSFTWSLEHAGHTSWLEELYVLPEQRERGIGTQLLHAAIDHVRALGCAAMDLEVEDSHARVKALYLREGFRAHTRSRFVLALRQ